MIAQLGLDDQGGVQGIEPDIEEDNKPVDEVFDEPANENQE